MRNQILFTSLIIFLAFMMVPDVFAQAPPAKITNFSATSLDGGVDLFWDPALLNGGAFVKYDITYGDQTKTFGTHSTSSTRVSDLNNGEEYTFTITATTSIGTSTPSTATATPAGVASKITDLKAVVDGGEVTLTWTAPNLNGGTFRHYEIFSFGGDESELVTDYSTTSKTLTFTNVVSPTFSIRTQTSAGNSLSSDEVTPTPFVAPQPQLPSQITDLRAIAGDESVILTWTAPNLNGGEFEKYDIEYDDRILSFSTHSKTNTIISNLNSGEEYTFTITATTSIGTSVSPAVTATPVGLPSKITDLKAVANDGEFVVTWTAPNLNGGSFVSYEISLLNGDSERITDQSTTSKIIKNPNNLEFTFTIVTHSSVGTSVISNTVTSLYSAPQPQLPSPITDLSATVDDGTVTLTWTTPNLNGGTFLEYDIFYDGNSEGVKLFEYQGTSRTFTGLSVSRDHVFTVVTKTSAGTSLPSNAVTVPSTAPVTSIGASQITDLSATAGDESVTLTWTASNLTHEFFNYEITYGGETVNITPHSTTSTTISNLNNGEEYTFTIRTETSAGFSLQSNPVTATPSVPINTFVEVGNDLYKLTFWPPTTTGETSAFKLYAIDGTERSSLQAGYTASMFLIQDGEIKYTQDATYGEKNPCRGSRDRSCNTGPAFMINNVNSNVNPLQDLTIKIEITKAGDIGNDVVKTSIVLSSYLIKNSLFSIPNSQITDFAATAGVGEITLTWTAPNLNGGTFENYTITYGGETKKITSHSTTSTTIPDLNNGEEYTFTITATTSLGTSTLSDGITATPFSQTDGTIATVIIVSPPTTPDFTFTFENIGVDSSLDLSNRGIVDDADTFADLTILICDISSPVNTTSGLSASSVNKLEETNCREVTDKNALVFNLSSTNGIPQTVAYIVTNSNDLSSKGNITFAIADKANNPPTAPDISFRLEAGVDHVIDFIAAGVTDDNTEVSDLVITLTDFEREFVIYVEFLSGINTMSNVVTDENKQVTIGTTSSALSGFRSQDVLYSVTDSQGLSSTGTISFDITKAKPILLGAIFTETLPYGLDTHTIAVNPGDFITVIPLTYRTSLMIGLNTTSTTTEGGTIELVYGEGTRGNRPPFTVSPGSIEAIVYTPPQQNFVGTDQITLKGSVTADGVTISAESTLNFVVSAPQCSSQVGSSIAFGDQEVGETSDEQRLDISNTGDISSNIFLKGTDWVDVDDTDSSVIDIGQTRYSGTESSDFTSKTQLSNSNVSFDDNLESGTVGMVYLQLLVDLLVTGFTGDATQTITVVTSCDL